MPTRMLAAALALGLASPAFATEPGTPMDCSDLELAPGLTCTVVTPPLDDLGFVGQDDSAVDNDGRVLSRNFPLDAESVGSCGPFVSLSRVVLVAAFDATGSKTPLVRATSRCVDPTARYFESARALGIAFDAVRGALFVELASSCQRDPIGPGCPFTGPQDSRTSESLLWVARIDGFTPLADALPPPPLPLPLCSNGLDDDGDGNVDGGDSQCRSAADNDESRP